jgi:hypothetical protein
VTPLLGEPSRGSVTIIDGRVDDEAFVAEIGEVDHPTPRESVRLGDGDEARLRREHLDLELGLPRQEPGEGQVDPALEDLVDAPEKQLVDRDRHRGMQCGELSKRLRQQLASGRSVEPDSQLAGARGAGRAERSLGIPQELAAFPEKNFSGGCELDVATVALEKPDAELGFEATNLLAQRGLGDMKPLSGASEVQFLGDSDEVLDQTKVEPFHRPSLLIKRGLVLDICTARADPFRYRP